MQLLNVLMQPNRQVSQEPQTENETNQNMPTISQAKKITSCQKLYTIQKLWEPPAFRLNQVCSDQKEISLNSPNPATDTEHHK